MLSNSPFRGPSRKAPFSLRIKQHCAIGILGIAHGDHAIDGRHLHARAINQRCRESGRLPPRLSPALLGQAHQVLALDRIGHSVEIAQVANVPEARAATASLPVILFTSQEPFGERVRIWCTCGNLRSGFPVRPEHPARRLPGDGRARRAQRPVRPAGNAGRHQARRSWPCRQLTKVLAAAGQAAPLAPASDPAAVSCARSRPARRGRPARHPAPPRAP